MNYGGEKKTIGGMKEDTAKKSYMQPSYNQ